MGQNARETSSPIPQIQTGDQPSFQIRHGQSYDPLATPYLNSFSSDITMLAHYGQLNQCVARAKEIEEIYRVIDGGQHNVLLVEEHGCR